MCLWCEVEERVYHSYEDQERKALEAIRKVEQECPGTSWGGEDCPDRLRCIWERKLDYVVARMLRERLAVEMLDAELCGGADDPEGRATGRAAQAPRRFPPTTLPPHLLAAFERTIETIFDRLAPARRPTRTLPRKRRAPIPFRAPRDSAS